MINILLLPSLINFPVQYLMKNLKKQTEQLKLMLPTLEKKHILMKN